MITSIGIVHTVIRYPIKSMAGIQTSSAFLGWHGLQGDRRFAFRRLEDKSGFPWLTASKLPDLVLYQPMGLDENSDDPVPTQVRTPEGKILDLYSPELTEQVSQKYGHPLELMKFRHGIFDDADVSVIHQSTIEAICREAGYETDARRFRGNIIISSDAAKPFIEDTWVNGRLIFGEDETSPQIAVTMRDLRCMMINIDPNTGTQNPNIMKTALRLNDNYAGIYGSVVRTGMIRVGQRVNLWTEE